MKANLVPQRSDRVAHRLVLGRAVLVDPDDSSVRWLNPVATRIWELSTGSNALETIAQKLCEEFEVDFDTALTDAQEMVEQFEEKRLLTLS